jgi:hypothetical protein
MPLRVCCAPSVRENVTARDRQVRDRRIAARKASRNGLMWVGVVMSTLGALPRRHVRGFAPLLAGALPPGTRSNPTSFQPSA